MMHPDPIDDHAGCERMFRLRQPAGKCQPTTAGLCIRSG
jgi:hypothetical protein